MTDRFGGWQLESLIAVGGVGEVWRAVRNGSICALKRLHTHLARNDEARALFATEQMLATSLPRHPNLIHGTEAAAVDDLPYIALALVPGEDLRRIVAPPATSTGAPVATAVPLPRARALAIVMDAANATTHLHAQGWIHGDINPGNLVVDEDHTVLIDLGVTRRIGDGGVVRGTHAYMAPEQVRGEIWTPATDVFALGVVLWELVAGRRLFHRGPPWLTMAAVVEEPAPPLADPALDAIVQGALQKDPARRTASAAELAAALCDG